MIKKRTVFIFLLSLLLLSTIIVPVSVVAEDSDPWSDWSFCRKLTFNNSAQSEDLVDFTVLVKLNSSNFDFSRAQDDGDDVIFVDSDNSTLLRHHWGYYDSVMEEAYGWFKVPQIDALSNVDHVFMRYGNEDASNIEDEEGTYDSSSVGVWHLDESSGTVVPNTLVGPDGVAVNVEDVDWISGKIGNCLNLDGITEYVNLGDTGDFERDQPFSIGVWTTTVSSGVDFLMTRMDSSAPYTGWQMFVRNAKMEFYLINHYQDNYIGVAGTTSISDGSWHLVFVTYDGTSLASGIKLYIDGDLETSTVRGDFLSSTTLTTADCNLGARSGGNVWLGKVDESTISDTERSDDWVGASYLSMTCQFITYGDEVYIPESPYVPYPTNPGETVNISQVVNPGNAGQKADDAALFEWLLTYDTNVTQVSVQDMEGKSIDYWTQFHLIILPKNIYSGFSIDNLLYSGAPIITMYAGHTDDIGLGTGTQTFAQNTRDFCVVDNTHNITSELPTGDWTWSGSGFMWTCGTEGTATVLVDKRVVGEDILVVHDIKQYAFFGWYRATQWPDEGWDMMLKTIEWAINVTTMPPKPEFVLEFTVEVVEETHKPGHTVHIEIATDNSGYDVMVDFSAIMKKPRIAGIAYTQGNLWGGSVDVQYWLDTYLGSFGYTVEGVLQGAAPGYTSTQWEEYELVFVFTNNFQSPQTDLSSLFDSNVPIIMTGFDEDYTSDVGLGDGTYTKESKQTFYVTDNTHPITQGFFLGELSFTSPMWTTRIGSDVTVLIGDNGSPVKAYLATSSEPRRAWFGYYRGTQAGIEAESIFIDTVAWTLGLSSLRDVKVAAVDNLDGTYSASYTIDYVPPFGLLDVVITVDDMLGHVVTSTSKVNIETMWLEEVTGYVEEIVPRYKNKHKIEGNSVAKADVYIDTLDGELLVVIAGYANSPGGTIPGGLGSYVDVYLSDVSVVSVVEVRLHTDNGLTGEELVYYLSGTEWLECSNTGVDISGGYTWVQVDWSTAPDLSYLLGGPLADGNPGMFDGFPASATLVGTFMPVIVLVMLAAFMVGGGTGNNLEVILSCVIIVAILMAFYSFLLGL